MKLKQFAFFGHRFFSILDVLEIRRVVANRMSVKELILTSFSEKRLCCTNLAMVFQLIVSPLFFLILYAQSPNISAICCTNVLDKFGTVFLVEFSKLLPKKIPCFQNNILRHTLKHCISNIF